MLKQLFSSISGLIILITILLTSVSIIFSYPYFEYHNIHTASLDLLNNVVTPIELRKVNIMGFYLVANEIKHLQDVSVLVNNIRSSLIILVPLSLILIFTWKTIRNAVIIKTWLWTGLIISIIATAYNIGGSKIISSYLHPIFFPQGNWSFNNLSLIRRIYTKDMMETGAIFCISFTVITLAILTILVLWRNKQNT